MLATINALIYAHAIALICFFGLAFEVVSQWTFRRVVRRIHRVEGRVHQLETMKPRKGSKRGRR